LTAKDINNSIGQTRVDVLYVCPLKKNSVESILKISRDKKICTYTGVPAYVVAGLVVGFDDEDGKPKILINLEEAKLQGADFSSKLLRISRIIN
ncbi:MAG: YfiR family protein, partial [Candidatus Krumholzibacteriota bacterium]|nr:YfiR family protein [Candidatus Krumholzibacteriota bacterium]